MKINVEIPVMVWGYKKGSETHKTFVAKTEREIEIRSLSSDDVPEVCSFEVSYDGKVRRQTLYGHEGSLFSATNHIISADGLKFSLGYGDPIHPFFSIFSNTLEDRVNFLNRNAGRRAKYQISPPEILERDTSGIPLMEELIASLKNDPGRMDDVEASIQTQIERIKKCIVVDGRIMIPSGEPLLVIRFDAFQSVADISMMLSEPSSVKASIMRDSGTLSEFYSLREMQAFADRVGNIFLNNEGFERIRAGGKDFRVKRSYEISKYNISDESYLRPSASSFGLLTAANCVQSSFFRNVISYGDDTEHKVKEINKKIEAYGIDTFSLMHQLNNAVSKWDTTEEPLEIEALMRLFFEMREMNGDLAKIEQSRFPIISGIFQMWEDRDVEIEIKNKRSRDFAIGF